MPLTEPLQKQLDTGKTTLEAGDIAGGLKILLPCNLANGFCYYEDSIYEAKARDILTTFAASRPEILKDIDNLADTAKTSSDNDALFRAGYLASVLAQSASGYPASPLPPSSAKAVTILDQCAKAGHTAAFYVRAHLYIDAGSSAEATNLMQQAADNDHLAAVFHMESIAGQKLVPTKRYGKPLMGYYLSDNDWNAVRWLREGSNSPRHNYLLACCYQHGRGVEKNAPKAEDLYVELVTRREEEKKDATKNDATYYMACCLMNGIGIAQDKKAAFDLYSSIAGNHAASAYAVSRHHKACGNALYAAHWWRIAEENGGKRRNEIPFAAQVAERLLDYHRIKKLSLPAGETPSTVFRHIVDALASHGITDNSPTGMTASSYVDSNIGKFRPTTLQKEDIARCIGSIVTGIASVAAPPSLVTAGTVTANAAGPLGTLLDPGYHPSAAKKSRTH